MNGWWRLGAPLLAASLGLTPAVRIGAEASAGARPAPELAPLPPMAEVDGRKAALGLLLFFDPRLSGDGSIACATCHVPARAWADGLPLAKGYPGSLYFRNTPTLLNAAHKRHAFWDGRLPASDLPTVVRDHISEAHFLQADGRLVIERLRQVPEYEAGFIEAFGGEPSYGRILEAVAAHLRLLRSENVPLDRFLTGDRSALSAAAGRGLALFRGRAGCIRCHHGPMLSDGGFHDLGVPENRDIFRSPERHITFRRFFKLFGVPEYASLRQDVGRFAVTKQEADRGRFATPSLREVARTAPYMHNGVLATLAEVVAFYDRGGGRTPPLGLSAADRADLVAFLEALSGAPGTVPAPKLPDYQLRPLGRSGETRRVP